MNNNKKILKRSVASFLAAVNIFNFAGGSGKAFDLKCSTMPSFDYSNDDIERLANNLWVLCDKLDVFTNKLKNNDLKLECKETLGGIDVYKYQMEANSAVKKTFDIVYVEILKCQSSEFDFVKLKEYLRNNTDYNKLGFVFYNDKTANNQFNHKYIEESEILFVNIDVLDYIKKLGLNNQKNLQDYFNFLKHKDLLEHLDKEKENLKKEKESLEKEKEELLKDKVVKLISNGTNISKILSNLIKSLNESLTSLKEDSDSLSNVRNGLKCIEETNNGTEFKLIGSQNFLGDVKFKYGTENSEIFSINELGNILEKSGFIEKFEAIKPIDLNEISKKSSLDEQEKNILDVEKYKTEIQKYTKTLNEVIDAINICNELKNIKEEYQKLKNNNDECNGKVGTILEKLNKEPNSSNELAQNLDDISTEVNNLNSERDKLVVDLDAANSRAKRLVFATCASCIGTLVTLGCVFQNELKNACDTVYKKVLELKNSILG